MSVPTQSPIFGTPISCVLTGINGLANNSAVQSNVIDLSSLPLCSGVLGSVIPANTIPDDVILDFTIKTASGSLGANPAVNWYVGALVQGSTLPAGLSGVTGSYTVPTTGGLSPIKAQGIGTAAVADVEGPVSLYNYYGFVPKKISVVVSNLTGLAFDASNGGGCNVTPVYNQYPSY